MEPTPSYSINIIYLIITIAVVFYPLYWMYVKYIMVTCKHCGRRFVTPLDLQNHKKVIHQTDKAKKCYNCGEEFSSAKSLLFHCKSEHDVIDYFFKTCYVCGKHFHTAKGLLDHCKENHDVIDYNENGGVAKETPQSL